MNDDIDEIIEQEKKEQRRRGHNIRRKQYLAKARYDTLNKLPNELKKEYKSHYDDYGYFD